VGERFKLDENLPHQALALSTKLGHEAETVHEERLVGEPDTTILNACVNERRILVTLDLDFSDIRQYPPSSHCGIWVLRPATQSIRDTLSVLRGAVALVGIEPTSARLWLVEPGRVRIRE